MSNFQSYIVRKTNGLLFGTTRYIMSTKVSQTFFAITKNVDNRFPSNLAGSCSC